RHNRQRLHEARQMEDRARRLLVDDAALFRFFDARVPRKVVDRRALLEWAKTLSADDARALELDWSDLGLDGPLSLSAFPTRFKVGRNALTLTYRFAPGERDDGATLRVPEALTDQMDAGALQWLVPGWLDEKVNRLLRGLPKAQRKRLAPIQDTSRAFLAGAGLDEGFPEVSLHEALATFASVRVGEPVAPSAFADIELAPYLNVRVAVLDERGRVRRATRHVAGWLSGQRRVARPIAANRTWHRDDMTRWDLGDLPDEVRVRSGGVELVGRPVLAEQGSAVALRVFADPVHANVTHERGVARLALGQLKDKRRYLQKQLADANALSLLYGTLGEAGQLFDDLALCAVRDVAPTPLADVRSESAFDALLDAARRGIVASAQTLATQTRSVLEARRAVMVRLDARLERSHPAVVADIREQLERLVSPQFLRDTPDQWRPHLPRFLKAVNQRLDRLQQRGNESPALLSDVQTREARLAAVTDPALRLRLVTYRWLLEEYRVSLFSQPIRTSRPVSAKRLDGAWDEAHAR
ncbi:MAG: DUF3418 domain-containing protein, partial [Pseudomonadota bacterium]